MGELRYNIDSIKRIKTEGRGGGLRGFVKQLNRSVLKASKISSTDPDFLNILEEAEAYLGIEV